MGHVEDKVVFITGATRGQGPQPCGASGRRGRRHHRGGHLRRYCDQPDPFARPEDLDETARLVEKTGRRITHPG